MQGSAIPRSEFSDADSDDLEQGLSPDVTVAVDLGGEAITPPAPAGPRDVHTPEV
jgi:hypothetical protein